MFSVFTLKYRMSLRGTSSQFSRKLKGTPGELEDVLEMSFLIVEHQSGFNRTGIRVFSNELALCIRPREELLSCEGRGLVLGAPGRMCD